MAKQYIKDGIMLYEQGDPPEICIFRQGPDGATEENPVPPKAVTKGCNLGLIYWAGWGPNGDWETKGYGVGRATQIYSRLQDIPDEKSRGGSLHFGVSPKGTSTPRDTLILPPGGGLEIPPPTGTPQAVGGGALMYPVRVNGKWKMACRWPDGTLSYLRPE